MDAAMTQSSPMSAQIRMNHVVVGEVTRDGPQLWTWNSPAYVSWRSKPSQYLNPHGEAREKKKKKTTAPSHQHNYHTQIVIKAPIHINKNRKEKQKKSIKPNIGRNEMENAYQKEQKVSWEWNETNFNQKQL